VPNPQHIACAMLQSFSILIAILACYSGCFGNVLRLKLADNQPDIGLQQACSDDFDGLGVFVC
jgi:hypothetical protein